MQCEFLNIQDAVSEDVGTDCVMIVSKGFSDALYFFGNSVVRLDIFTMCDNSKVLVFSGTVNRFSELEFHRS